MRILNVAGLPTLNIVIANIGKKSDLMKTIHLSFAEAERANSLTWKTRVLHLRSTEKYELKNLDSLSGKNKIGEYDRFKYVNEGGLLTSSFPKPGGKETTTFEQFQKRVEVNSLPLPTNVEELNALWIGQNGITDTVKPYKLDLQLPIEDNRIDLVDFDNPLTFLAKEKDLKLYGIQDTYVLIGGARSSSPSHYEDKRFGSINKCCKGSAIWIAIFFDDNDILFEKISKNLKAYCDAVLASKNYIVLPQLLDKWGIRYCVALQEEGDIIVTLPGAVHLVINLDYTIKQAVNFIPTRWFEPILDHEDCYCKVTRPVPEDMGFARALQHGQSLASVLKNSIILSSIESWKRLRYKNGKSISGLVDEAIGIPPAKKRLRICRDFGDDYEAFKTANKSLKPFFCKVCVEDGTLSEIEGQMGRSSFYSHVAEFHVRTKSTKICPNELCGRRFGNPTSMKSHKCFVF